MAAFHDCRIFYLNATRKWTFQWLLIFSLAWRWGSWNCPDLDRDLKVSLDISRKSWHGSENYPYARRNNTNLIVFLFKIDLMQILDSIKSTPWLDGGSWKSRRLFETCHVSWTCLFPKLNGFWKSRQSSLGSGRSSLDMMRMYWQFRHLEKVSTVSKYQKSWSKLEFETVETPCLSPIRK
jgi:hypothetical protein